MGRLTSIKHRREVDTGPPGDVRRTDGKERNDPAVSGDRVQDPDRDASVRWFWGFALAHLALWTILPTLTQPNAPLDTLEMLYWGHEWEWGYEKHPPLPGWIAEAASLVFSRSAWATYLASQCFVIGCFWAAWQLAREVLRPWHALCAALVLEASYYYNFTTPELNNNVVSRTFWALTILFLFRALTRRQSRWWALTGASLALGMLSKYDTAVLAATVVGFLAVHPVARRSWRTAGPYVAIAVGLALFLPHVHWLVQSDFATIRYFQNRSSSDGVWLDHLVNPLRFLATQWVSILPMALLATPLVAHWRLRTVDADERFPRDYLLVMVAGPLLLIMVASAVAGFSLRSMWGASLWTHAGVALLFLVPLRAELPSARRLFRMAVTVTAVFAVAFGLRNTLSPHLQSKGSRVHYPGKQLADEVERRWQRHSDRPLELVAGAWWPAANVAFYGRRRATVFADLDSTKCPWADEERLREMGGVILWEEGKNSAEMWKQWKTRFPQAEVASPIEMPWQTSAELPPVRVGVAIVPPATRRR